MTDDELAEELEFHAKHGISAAPALQHEASERIRALSAHVALLKASLAQAEREAEKATESAEPFGYFRVTPFGLEDCAETDDGAIPLYTAPQPAANAEPAIPAFDCWSSGDGECWHLHPADACILDDVFSDGAPKVGDEYEVLAGWRSVEARYRITSVDEDGGVEVECISHAREAAPQPDRVAELEKKVRELEAIAEARLRDLNSAGDALADAGYTDEGQPLWADIAKLAGERDAAKAEVERLRDRLEYARNYVQPLVDHGESVHAAGLVRDLDSAMVGKEAQS